jgi:hypothetical protein
MSKSRITAEPRAGRAKALVRLALKPRKVAELRRALMLAVHHTMSTAKPEERSAAAMEAADYKMLDTYLEEEMAKQGFLALAAEPGAAERADDGERG